MHPLRERHPEPSLFSVKGPWLHAFSTTDPPPSLKTFQEVLNGAFGLKDENIASLEVFVENVSNVAADAIADYIWGSLDDPDDAGHVGHKHNLLWCLGMKPSGVPNKPIRQFLLQKFLPILVLDALLHAADPTRPAPLRSRLHSRHFAPKWNVKINTKMIQQAVDWPNELRLAHFRFQKYTLDHCSKGNTKAADAKREFLQTLRLFGNRKIDGSKQGSMEVTIDHLRAQALKDPLAVQLKVTAEDVITNLTSNDLQYSMTPLLMAVAVCPLRLLDELEYYTESWYSVEYYIQAWVCKGNEYLQDSDHPLTKAGRRLWQAVVEVALNVSDTATALTAFYGHPDVQSAMEPGNCTTEQASALIFRDDPQDIANLQPPVDSAGPETSSSAEGETSSSVDLPIGPELRAQVEQLHYTLGPDWDPQTYHLPAPPPPKEIKRKAKKITVASEAADMPDAQSEGVRRSTRVKNVSEVQGSLSGGPVEQRKRQRNPGKGKAKAAQRDKEQEAEPERNSEQELLYDPEERVFAVPLVAPDPPPTDAERAAEQYKTPKNRLSPKKGAPRLVAKPVCLTLHEPLSDPNAIRTHEVEWFPFASTDDDAVLREMLTTEVKSNNLPLHMQASARDPTPSLKPSINQSVMFVVTRYDWVRLSDKRKQEIFRNRSVVIVPDSDPDPPPPFDEETLERFRNLDSLAHIQDHEERGTEGPLVQIGTLRDLLDKNLRGGKQVFNCLQNTMEDGDIPIPPGFHAMTTDERAMHWTRDIPELPHTPMPSKDRRWVIIANAGAHSGAHADTSATDIAPLTGMKIWALGVRDNVDQSILTRHAFDEWEPYGSNTKLLRWEFLPLTPGMILLQRPGEVHYVISHNACIAYGHHWHCSSTIGRAVANILQNTITDASTGNANHLSAQWTLLRVFDHTTILIHKNKHTEAHGVNPETPEGFFDLLMLMCFVVLFPALNSEAYVGLVDDEGLQAALPIHPDTYREMTYAWDGVQRLLEHLDGNYSLVGEDAEDERVTGIFRTAVVCMAGCLSRYKESFPSATAVDDLASACTFERFRIQLVKAMSAFESRTFSATHGTDPLPKMFWRQDKRMLPMNTFLPWDVTDKNAPHLIPNPATATGQKRSAHSALSAQGRRSVKRAKTKP
ncbi:hypothetical protein C8R46DRAFT_1071821 [Mycena filopes]|nr:hypothetical protein C8R46DRAFT_1071821 [Mycena filopes]